ncbi:hypothetical protein D3C84_1262130 [compost metagenome]
MVTLGGQPERVSYRLFPSCFPKQLLASSGSSTQAPQGIAQHRQVLMATLWPLAVAQCAFQLTYPRFQLVQGYVQLAAVI